MWRVVLRHTSEAEINCSNEYFNDLEIAKAFATMLVLNGFALHIEEVLDGCYSANDEFEFTDEDADNLLDFYLRRNVTRVH